MLQPSRLELEEADDIGDALDQRMLHGVELAWQDIPCTSVGIKFMNIAFVATCRSCSIPKLHLLLFVVEAGSSYGRG